MNNIPILTQSEENDPIFKGETEILPVNVSICMSATCEIEVPKDFQGSEDALKDYVRNQIYLPQDAISDSIFPEDWTIDDFCVCY